MESLTKVLFNLRTFFEREAYHGVTIALHRVHERLLAATGLPRGTLNRYIRLGRDSEKEESATVFNDGLSDDQPVAKVGTKLN